MNEDELDAMAKEEEEAAKMNTASGSPATEDYFERNLERISKEEVTVSESPPAVIATPARLSTDDSVAEPALATVPKLPVTTAPKTRAVVSTPEPPAHHAADAPSESVVDIPISPGAERFINTMSDCGSRVGNLGNKDVTDGMLELSRRSTDEAKRCFGVFKRHTLDVAVTVFKNAPAEEGRMRAVVRKSEFYKIVALPVAGVYAMMAILCMMAYAFVFYGPMALGKAKAKMIEWRAIEHASTAAAVVTQGATSAYQAASETALAKQGTEYLGQAQKHASTAYETVAANSVVQVVANKGSEAADLVRSKVAEQLDKIDESSAMEEAKAAPAAV